MASLKKNAYINVSELIFISNSHQHLSFPTQLASFTIKDKDIK